MILTFKNLRDFIYCLQDEGIIIVYRSSDCYLFTLGYLGSKPVLRYCKEKVKPETKVIIIPTDTMNIQFHDKIEKIKPRSLDLVAYICDVEETLNIIKKKISPEEITEKTISQNLWTRDLDLLIRTGKEQRISNFLIWQAAYSELYFCPKYWPDFEEKDLDQALADYSRRQRRFGK